MPYKRPNHWAWWQQYLSITDHYGREQFDELEHYAVDGHAIGERRDEAITHDELMERLAFERKHDRGVSLASRRKPR